MKIGIDLGGTGLKIGSFVNGIMTGKVVKPSPGASMNCDESLAYIISAIKEFDLTGLEGIGIGVPSVVDSENGIVYDVVNIPSWKRVELGSILTKEFNTVVKVNNDANCFAISEKKFGAAAECRDMAGVTLGTGLGVGIIIDNNLYNGANTGAGEIGNAPYLDQNYEYYCSGNFFTAVHNISGKELSQRAASGDAEAISIWNEFGHHLGEFLKLVMYAYDPQMIVFGGSVANAYPFFEKAMKDTLGSFLYQNSLKNLVITTSSVEDSGIKGAVALLG